MRRIGRHLIAAFGIGAVLLGSSYGYGRYRVESLLRRAVAPSLQVASLRLEPDWSRLQLCDVRWTENGELRRVDRIAIERPVDVLRSGRWRFDTVSLEGLQLEGFGGAERSVRQETERRMRRHGLMLADDAVPELPPDIAPIIRMAIARSQGRWAARLASVRLQRQQVGDSTAAALRRDLPDNNPLRGRRDAQGQFAELRRLESQLAAIDSGLREESDSWQDESQRLREECAEAARDAHAAFEDRLRRRHRERVEANLAALGDALVESLVSDFVSPMAAAAHVARTSHEAIRQLQTPPETRGTDFFGLEQARSIRIDRLVFSGYAVDGQRKAHFSGEMFPQAAAGDADDVAEIRHPGLSHGVVLLCSRVSNDQPRLRLCGGVSSDGIMRLTSAATLERFTASAETPTLPSFRLTLCEPSFRLKYEEAAGRVKCHIGWSSPGATVAALEEWAAGQEIGEAKPIELQEFCGSLEVEVTPEGIQIDADLRELDAIAERFAPDPPMEKVASAAAAEPTVAVVDSAISEMLASRRAECREIRSDLAELRQSLAARQEAVAGRTAGPHVRTASGASAAAAPRSPVR